MRKIVSVVIRAPGSRATADSGFRILPRAVCRPDCRGSAGHRQDGKVVQRGGGNVNGYLPAFRLEQRRFGIDRYAFARRADFKLRVDTIRTGNLYHQTCADELLEARRSNSQLIISDRQLSDGVITGG